MHGLQKEAVLCAWAITTEGDKVLLSLVLGKKESYDAWLMRAIDQVVARQLAHMLLSTSHAQLPIQGARSSLA